MTDRDPLLNSTEVAQLMGELTGMPVSSATVRAYKSRRKIPPPDEDGRWYRSTIEAWIARRPPTLPRQQVLRLQQRIRTAARRRSEDALPAAVVAARREGLSWAQIAEALPPKPDGSPISKQAAHSRYSRLV